MIADCRDLYLTTTTTTTTPKITTKQSSARKNAKATVLPKRGVEGVEVSVDVLDAIEVTEGINVWIWWALETTRK